MSLTAKLMMKILAGVLNRRNLFINGDVTFNYKRQTIWMLIVGRHVSSISTLIGLFDLPTNLEKMMRTVALAAKPKQPIKETTSPRTM